MGISHLEERLLSPENLDGGGGVLGEVHEAAGVSDQPRSHQLAHQDGQVGGDRHHAVLQVLVQLAAVLLDLDNLRALEIIRIIIRDLHVVIHNLSFSGLLRDGMLRNCSTKFVHPSLLKESRRSG